MKVPSGDFTSKSLSQNKWLKEGNINPSSESGGCVCACTFSLMPKHEFIMCLFQKKKPKTLYHSTYVLWLIYLKTQWYSIKIVSKISDVLISLILIKLIPDSNLLKIHNLISVALSLLPVPDYRLTFSVPCGLNRLNFLNLLEFASCFSSPAALVSSLRC